ncbi:MAG: ABC transporter substrate-binding protein [Planctomycetota bacterium]|nr:ABC transporter substrate-binding protein [Planctomycetota bacterium]
MRSLCILFALICLHALAVTSRAGDSTPPRIISLYAAHTEVLLRLGARDAIIGVSRQESYDGPETVDWNPPTFSIRDDVEKFLAAKPDLILARPQHLAAAGRLSAMLERMGVRFVSLQVTRADELYDYWRTLAGFVGKEAEAERMIEAFDGEIGRYGAAAESFAPKPGVFLEAIHKEVKTFVPESIPAWLVRVAGGVYIADDAVPTTPGVIIADYGPERLLERADGIDVFVAQEGAMNRTPIETIRKRTVYQPLAAFKSGRVCKVPEAILSRPTPSLLDGAAILAGHTGLAEHMKTRPRDEGRAQ